MKIYRPCKSNRISQGWGENNACAKTDINGQMVNPVQIIGKTSQNFCPIGTKSFYKLMGMLGHSGIDFATWYGESVYHCAEFDGWARTEIDGSGGVGIDIVSNEPLVYCEKCKEKHYIKMRYWHNKQVMVADKKQVKSGDFIAYSDTTGASSGNHIHLGLKWCDKDGYGIHSDNGYYGSFDPTPYYENVFVVDVLKVKEKALTTIDLARKVIFQVQSFIINLTK